MSRIDNLITDLLDVFLERGASHLYLFSGLTPRFHQSQKWTEEVKGFDELDAEELKEDFLSLEITTDDRGKATYTHPPADESTEYIVFLVDVFEYRERFELTFKYLSHFDSLTTGTVDSND